MYKKKFKLELDKAPLSKRQILQNAVGIVVKLRDHNFLVCFPSLLSLIQPHHLSSVFVNNCRKHLRPFHMYSPDMATVPNAAEEKRRLEQMKYRLKQG